MEEELIYYSNGTNILFCNTNNQFVYYCKICLYINNTYSVINSKYYSSYIFIPNVIESYFINKHIENTCELFSAPKKWLNENNYKVISKPEKSKLKIKTVTWKK